MSSIPKSHLYFSGNSPILRELVELCLSKCPWITLIDTGFAIDWDALWAKWRSDKNSTLKINDDLLSSLKSNMPFLPWAVFCDFDYYRQSNNMFVAQVGQKNAHFSSLGFLDLYLQKFTEILEIFDHEVAKNRDSLQRQSYQRFSEQIKDTLRLYKKVDLTFQTSATYLMKNRFAVARTDMMTMVKGEVDNTLFYDHRDQKKTGLHRAESWRLSRRIIRLRHELLTHLAGQVKSLEESHFSCSLVEEKIFPVIDELAHLEKQLNRHLILFRRNHHSELQMGYFEINSTCQVIPEHESLPNYHRTFIKGFSRLFKAQSMLKEILRHVSLEAESVINVFAFKGVKQIFEEMRPLYQKAEKQIDDLFYDKNSFLTEQHLEHYRQLEAAIEQMILETPIFTLLFSGVLSLFRETKTINDREEHSYYLGTSIAATAAYLSDKYLAALPMTYLGLENLEDAQDEAIAPDDQSRATSSEQNHLSGQVMWTMI